MNKEKILVATHSGKNFHTDEVVAIAILEIYYEKEGKKLEIIRTREKEEYSKADIKVDVGDNYDPKNFEFDHHQPGFEEKRNNGVLYASAGLVWKHYGMELVNSKEAFNHVDKIMMQYIDLGDNGIDSYEIKNPPGIRPYNLGMILSAFRPVWNEKSFDTQKGFIEAIKLSKEILGREIKIANGIKEAKEKICKAIEKAKEEWIIFDKPVPPFPEEMAGIKKISYVICPRSGDRGYWASEAIRKNKESYESKKPFPKSWAGLKDEKLQEITGVKEAHFCHKARFLVVAKTKEAILELTKKSLDHKE